MHRDTNEDLPDRIRNKRTKRITYLIRKYCIVYDIDWNIIINEAKNQIALGKKRAVFDLGCFLEDLKEKMHVDKIPQSVLDDLYAELSKSGK